MLADIGFDAGEGGAEVTLRLDEAVAAGENLLAAHRSEDGWEWLEFERLTDEDGRQYVSFHTDSFSPFAVLSLTETDAAGADLADYAAQRGGSLSFRLTNEDGTEPEADEDGVYIVEQGVEFVLHMDVACPEGFAEGLYAAAFPEGVIPSAGEGVLAAEETEIGRWSADGESAVFCCGWMKPPKAGRSSRWSCGCPSGKPARSFALATKSPCAAMRCPTAR